MNDAPDSVPGQELHSDDLIAVGARGPFGRRRSRALACLRALERLAPTSSPLPKRRINYMKADRSQDD